MNYTFVIHSKTHGDFTVTAPLRFKDQIDSHRWWVVKMNRRGAGREFVPMTSERIPGGPVRTSGGLLRYRRPLQLHRLVWRLAGHLETPEIDHVDGFPLNNAETNLRAATKRQNRCNASMRRNNKSGAIGVRLRPKTGRFSAYAKASDGKQLYLGTFDSLVEAATARDAAAVREYGEFAVLNYHTDR